MPEVLSIIFAASTAWILSLGFFLGLKHATEADHLAAVSTIVSERRGLFSSAIVGGLWGLGHTISLVIAGVFVLLLNFHISERTEQIMEFCVGVMLILLGLNVLRQLTQGDEIHSHPHDGKAYTHSHLIKDDSKDEQRGRNGFTFSPRALIIGMVHGLAGSAALMLLVIPTIESRIAGLLYIVIFGIGSIGGMMIMSFLVGLPFQLTNFRFSRFNIVLQGLAGVLSVMIGLMIVYEKGFTEGLLK